MTKTFIASEQAYREFAFRIIEKHPQTHIALALGVDYEPECYDYNALGQPIDENGWIIPDLTPATLALHDHIKQLEYPIVCVHLFEKNFDRTGPVRVCLCEWVSLKDFKSTV